MNSKNKLAERPIRSLLYTMAIPLMLSLIVQSLYNIVDSIFVAKLSETALTAASLVYAIQFLLIAVGVGTAVGLNALLSRKIGEHKVEEACQAAIPIVGYNYGDKKFQRIQQTWNILLPTGAVIALCGTVIFWCFPGQLWQLHLPEINNHGNIMSSQILPY